MFLSGWRQSPSECNASVICINGDGREINNRDGQGTAVPLSRANVWGSERLSSPAVSGL